MIYKDNVQRCTGAIANWNIIKRVILCIRVRVFTKKKNKTRRVFINVSTLFNLVVNYKSLAQFCLFCFTTNSNRNYYLCLSRCFQVIIFYGKILGFGKKKKNRVIFYVFFFFRFRLLKKKIIIICVINSRYYTVRFRNL